MSIDGSMTVCYGSPRGEKKVKCKNTKIKKKSYLNLHASMFICRLIRLQIVTVRNDLSKKKKCNIYDNTGSTVDF